MLVDFGYSDVNLLRDRESTSLCPSVYYVLVIYGFQCRRSMLLNSLVFHTSVGISSSPATFLFSIFHSIESCPFCVNYPSSMSS